jgi:hypothetical protein
MRRTTDNNHREQGQMLVLFVLAIGALVGFMAMAIDVGLLFEDRRHLQNTADAAALAGVAELPLNPAAAKKYAQDWVLKHNITADKIKTIEVRTTSFPNDTVYVELEQDFEWVFARVLGQSKSAVGAQAAAQVGSLIGGHDIMPWAIMIGDTNCLTPSGAPLYNGLPCTVKVGAGSAISGWYGALDMDGTGGGAAEYQSNILDGQTSTSYCVSGEASQWCESSTINTLPGNMVAGTGKGIAARLASEATCADNGNDIDDFNEVFGLTGLLDPKYNVLCPASPRLVLVPIVSFSSIPVKTVTIEGWALAYLVSYSCVSGNGSACGGSGHWEVQIQIVDAAYSETAGFMGAYNALSGITVRRLIE